MALTTGQATAGTQFADAMKTFYLGPLNDQVYKSSVLLNRLQKNAEDVSGNFAYIPLISARNPGIGSRKDVAGLGPSLPVAGAQGYKSATFRMALHYGRGAISGPVVRASKNNEGAFAQAMDTEMKGLSERLPQDLNRQLWSYGHGRAASFVADQSTTTDVLVSSKSIMGAKVGDRVHVADIGAGFNGTPTGGTTITNITRDGTATTHTLILAAASGAITAASDALYFGQLVSGAEADSSSKAQEMFGIPAAIDSGALGADEVTAAAATEFIAGSLSYGGIDRTAAASDFWRASKLTNPDGAGTDRALTVALMEQAFLTCIAKGATESNLEIYTNFGLWATFGLLHIGDRVFNDFKKTLEGGWIALEFNGRPVMYDRDAPRSKIWFIDMNAIMLLTQSGYEFMDKDGSVLARISDRDAYEFTLYRDVQLGSRRCNTSCLLADVQSTMHIEYNS